MPIPRFELQTVITRDVDKESDRRSRQYGMPGVDEISAIVDKDPRFVTLLTSQRRLYAIYHELPTLKDTKLIQKEIFLATRQNYPEQTITSWFKQKESIKYLFYPWSIRYKEEELADLAYDTASAFIDFKWNGSANSPIRYLSKSALYFPAIICANKKNQPLLYGDYFDDPDVLTNVSFIDYFHDGKEIAGFGMFNRNGTSIFQGIPIEDIPAIIGQLPSKIDVFFALRKLGYLNGAANLDQLKRQINGLPENVEMKSYVWNSIARVKANLTKIIYIDNYKSLPHPDFIDLADIARNNKVYYYADRKPVKVDSIQFLFLEKQNEINPLRWQYLLNDSQKRMLKMLIEEDPEGRILRNLLQVSRILDKDKRNIRRDLGNIYKTLFFKEILIDQRGRTTIPGDIQYELIKRRETLEPFLSILSRLELDAITNLMSTDKYGNPMMACRTYAENNGLKYKTAYARLKSAWNKLKDLM
jgi:hypothetical protein